MSEDASEWIKVVEVGPRDGLQNETTPISTGVKVELIDRLSATGLSTIETTSFVSPRWVPQLADAAEVFATITRQPGTAYPVLVPNVTGLRRALDAGASEIAIFTAASDTFNRKNINAGIEESIERFQPVMQLALEHDLKVRGYISCVLGCPYEGSVDPAVVAVLTRRLLDMGCYEISLGDTIGIGTPRQAQKMLRRVLEDADVAHIAVHFHDTRGQALANILSCLDLGVRVVDASVSGLGGCPYADGASGNVATEDLLYMLDGMGLRTGVDLERLIEAGRFISAAMGRAPASKLGQLYANLR